MQLSLQCALVVLLAQGILALPNQSPNPQRRTSIEERGAADKKCKLDLILLSWALPGVKAKASSFCSTFIGSTITSTVSSTQTDFISATTTLPTVTNTILVDGTTTLPQSTDLTTAWSTIHETLTTFATTIQAPDMTSIQTVTVEDRSTIYVKKRTAPTKLPDFAAAYLSTKVSSACSCIVTAPSVSTVLVSAISTTTSTVVATVSPSVEVTNTVTHTVVPIPATLIVSDIKTETLTDFATATNPASTIIIPSTTILAVQETQPARCSIHGAYNIKYYDTQITRVANLSPRACYELCQSQPTCQAFYYGKSGPRDQGGECNTNSKNFRGHISENEAYLITFNDRNCPGAVL